jgi:hypothetical protein
MALSSAEKMRKWRSNPANLAHQRAQENIRRQASPRYILNLSLHNARKRRPVSISVDYLLDIWTKQNGDCALTGIKMTWGQGSILPTSISIDRIDQSLGYVEGNVRLLCHAVNCFRGRMTDEEMLAMARSIVWKQENLNRDFCTFKSAAIYSFVDALAGAGPLFPSEPRSTHEA